MRLLVLRFSAMGDVALLAPVLQALIRKYSSLSITLLTRKNFKPFFYNMPGVEIIGVDLNKDYRGLRGLYRLFREMKALGPYDAGVDVHDSTRTKVLKFFFRISGLRFTSIVKGRFEKRKQVRKKNKILKPLPHTVERYMNTFARSGFQAPIGNGPWINPDTISRSLAHEFLKTESLTKKNNFWIGIAPFAGHNQKMWPLEKTKAFLDILLSRLDAEIFLFGGGKKEIAILQKWKGEHSNVHLIAGNISLEGELAFIPRLDLMIAMDSLNMHLAALLGVKLLSIWGATHPYSGFGPYGQGEESIIQIPIEELPCRPCSIFGKTPCYRKDLACMNRIEPEHVFERAKSILYRNSGISETPETD